MWIFDYIPAYIWAPFLAFVAGTLVISALKALAHSRR